MTGNRDQRSTELVGHVLHKPGLPAAGRPLEHHRQFSLSGDGKQPNLPTDLGIKRLLWDPILRHIDFTYLLHDSSTLGMDDDRESANYSRSITHHDKRNKVPRSSKVKTYPFIVDYGITNCNRMDNATNTPRVRHMAQRITASEPLNKLVEHQPSNKE